MNDKVPSSMMTQHPDSASKSVSIQDEVEEAIHGLSPYPLGLGIDELMIDFEGKLTPYHQTSQIVMGLLDKGIVPGRDVAITPRVASATKETVFRQLMALMSIVEANVRAIERTNIQPISEVIIPMCESAEEIVAVRERIRDVIQLGRKEFKLGGDENSIQPIPLIEEIPGLLSIDSILSEYIEKSKAAGFEIKKIRIMLGRSDPALSCGLVPAVLGCKIALAQAFQIEKDFGIPVFPILGAGSLPFRGHVTLENINNVLETYPGVKTVTIQSAMRYDHGFEKTRKLALILKERLGERKSFSLTREVSDYFLELIAIFTKYYISTVLKIQDVICNISDIIPPQRDRLTRSGSISYARNIPLLKDLAKLIEDHKLREELQSLIYKAGQKFPRVISYVAAMYSIGIPPEFIGTGRGIYETYEKYGGKGIEKLVEYYPGIKNDMRFAGRYLALDVVEEFLPEEVIREIKSDVEKVINILDIPIGPRSPADEFYLTLLETSKPILKHILASNTKDYGYTDEIRLLQDLLLRQGKARFSLG